MDYNTDLSADEAGVIQPFRSAFAVLDLDRSGYLGAWELRVSKELHYRQLLRESEACVKYVCDRQDWLLILRGQKSVCWQNMGGKADHCQKEKKR
eukprot:1159686-Pelagomonas_calceolata.AAC.6